VQVARRGVGARARIEPTCGLQRVGEARDRLTPGRSRQREPSGAREVLDRFAEDFTKRGTTYDVIFDAVGRHSFPRGRRALKPGGVYATADLGFLYHVPLVALGTRFVGSRRAKLAIGRYRKEDLLVVKELVDEGKYRPVIDRTYPMNDVIVATRYVESEQKVGNVVLTIR